MAEIPGGDLGDWSDALYEAGCSDSSPGVLAGQPLVEFDREAESLEAAITSAVSQIESTGASVQGVELDHESVTDLATIV